MQQNHKTNFTVSYLTLRQAIGILGFLIPLVLPLGTGFLSCSNENFIQPSISHYYYSVMHIVFVGVLCLIAGFLLSYKGKSSFENIVSNIAGALALLVAIFPTSDIKTKFSGIQQNIKLVINPNWFDVVHHITASALFICFAIFCLKIFQAADDGEQPANFNNKKIRRNKTYAICGYIIVISILIILLLTFVFKKWGGDFKNYIFYFESTSLFAFGFSWLLKGTLEWPKSQYKFLQKTITWFR